MNSCHFYKLKLIKYVLDTYKDTLYSIIYENKDKVSKLIYNLNNKEFFDIIIHLNRKSYIGYYSLHISNDIKQCLLNNDYKGVLTVLKNPRLDEIMKNVNLSINFINKIKKLMVMEKMAYNYMLEKVILNNNSEISHVELNECKKLINTFYGIEEKYFERHKTKIAIIKYGEDVIYDINDLIYRCFKNIKDFDNDDFNLKTIQFMKKVYINESIIIENYLFNKNE